jgi:exodeoxyribonuclease-1
VAHEAAHDALSDVRATVALARKLRQAQPKLWDFCLKLRTKQAVWDEIGIGKPFLHISGMYGPERGCIAVVWPLAPHPTNKNELIVWDCAVDPAELLTLNAEAIRERLFVKQDALPEGVTRLPIKTIHVNKSPIVIGNLKTLSPAMAERWGHDVEAQLANAKLLAEKGRLLDGLWGDVFQREPFPPADVDEDLYGGFIGNEDRRALNRVRTTAPAQLAERAAQGKLAFQDARLDELVFRWRARNFPASLSADEAERWQAHLAARLHQGEGGAQTLAAFMERIDVLGETADERGEALLSALYDYAEQIAP